MNRTTGVHAANYPTEAEARAVLSEGDAGLAYIGVWQPPDLSVIGPGIHLFSNAVPAFFEAKGWTREDT